MPNTDDEAAMSGADFVKAIAKLALGQNGSARFLGVGDRTVRRWIAEDSVPAPVARFLRYLIGAKVTPEKAEAVIDKVRL